MTAPHTTTSLNNGGQSLIITVKRANHAEGEQ